MKSEFKNGQKSIGAFEKHADDVSSGAPILPKISEVVRRWKKNVKSLWHHHKKLSGLGAIQNRLDGGTYLTSPSACKIGLKTKSTKPTINHSPEIFYGHKAKASNQWYQFMLNLREIISDFCIICVIFFMKIKKKKIQKFLLRRGLPYPFFFLQNYIKITQYRIFWDISLSGR